MTQPVDQVRGSLYSLEQIRDRLAVTEPMNTVDFSVGDPIRFSAELGWQHGVKIKDADEQVPMYVILGGAPHNRRLTLTRGTLEAMCAAVGIRKDYVADCPGELLVPHLNYWYREGLFGKSRKGKDFQFVIGDEETALAFTKQGHEPFSNLALLDQTVAAIRERFGEVEILADHKFTHDLRRTIIRLIIPDASQVLDNTGDPDDTWSLGVELKNSLTSQSQTSFEGYLFRWATGSGQIDITANSGYWTQRKGASHEEVYAWARTAVSDVLSGLDGSLAQVQKLTDLSIEGSLSETLRDVFEHYKISLVLRPRIINYLEQYDREITMYVIMNAITRVANDPELEPSTVESLLRIGGDVPYSGDQRCGACHRILHIH